MSAEAKEIHAEDAFDAPSTAQSIAREAANSRSSPSSGAEKEIARREDDREQWINGLSQAERERVNKIDLLNERVRVELAHSNVQSLVLSYDATDEAVEQLERRLDYPSREAKVGQNIPLATPNRNEAINKAVAQDFAEEKVALSPLKKLRDLFAASNDAVAAAEKAKHEAALEKERLAGVFLKREGLKAQLSAAKADLERAQQVHCAASAVLEKHASNDAIVARYLNAVNPNSDVPKNVDHQVRHIEGRLNEFEFVVQAWTGVRDTLIHRIEVIEQELAKLEREYS